LWTIRRIYDEKILVFTTAKVSFAGYGRAKLYEAGEIDIVTPDRGIRVYRWWI
jgi:hypothetical protein